MLLTLGCSFTVKRWQKDKPWPHHVANYLGMDLLNISQEGESNSYMYRNALWALNEPEYKDKIELVVVGLSNWDRVEFPNWSYAEDALAIEMRYENEPMSLGRNGLFCKTKVFKPNSCIESYTFPKKYDHIGSSVGSLYLEDLDRLYLQHYNVKFYLDENAAHMLALTEICKARGIPIIFTQALLPFHKCLNPGDEDILNIKINDNGLFRTVDDISVKNVIDYMNETSPFRLLNKKLYAGIDLSPESIFYNDWKEPKYLWQYFVGRSKWCMGYHDMWGKDREKFLYEYDGHPNQRGHKLIAKTVIEHFEQIDNLDDYYNRDS